MRLVEKHEFLWLWGSSSFFFAISTKITHTTEVTAENDINSSRVYFNVYSFCSFVMEEGRPFDTIRWVVIWYEKIQDLNFGLA